jgi:hypothetical protein
LQHIHRDGHGLRANAVTRQHNNLHITGLL